jgi:uncharacterized protein YqfB (UPF0267 family)
MKLHELKIKHEYLVEIVMGRKTFELRKNDRDYQVGDLIHFVDINQECKGGRDIYIDKVTQQITDIYIDKDALYKITYVLKDVPQYGLDKDYCILAIKKLEIR